MNRKDFHSSTSLVVALAVAVYAATPGAFPVVDLRGYNGAELCLSIGAGGITFTGTNKVEFVLEHSDDGTTFVAVADTDLLGVSGTSNGIIKSLVAGHAAAAAYRFGYVGGRRYIRLRPVFGGTHGTGTPLAANVLLGGAHLQPTANQA